MSCASAGSCSAGAYYSNRSGQEAFVAAAVDQRGCQATTLALWPFRSADCASQRLAGGRAGVVSQSGRTFSACGPFCPWVVSNSTFWFSFSDR